MSDLYVVLKSRLPVVALRTHIGRERLQAAQDEVGLSNERLARLIPVSEKTWRRWKNDGQVPTYALPQVAKVLRLELVDAAPEPLANGSPGLVPLAHRLLEQAAGGVTDLLDGQQEALSTQTQILDRLAAIEAKLDELGARQPARPTRRTAQ